MVIEGLWWSNENCQNSENNKNDETLQAYQQKLMRKWMTGWWACEETAKLLVLQAYHENLLIVLIFHESSILDEEC